VAALSRRRVWLAWGIVALGLPALTAALLAAEDQVHLPSVLLLYLLVVVAVATIGGAWPAAAAAITAFLLANWYFTPPFHRLTIDATEDAVALVAFVVVAAVVSWLLAVATRYEATARADELKTALLTAVSHDLRTPLASIKASVTSLLQDDVAWTERDRNEFLTTIDEETDRLNGLVGNLLDMSRIQTGSVRLTLRGVGLEEVVPAVVNHLGARADDVELDVPESLPRAWVDPGLLERVLANIVDNALEWSPGSVRIEAGVDHDLLEVRVIDRGPGIPAGERARLFEPFQRLDDRGHGVGLGLAVARGFLAVMDGRINAEETPGGGLTMVVRLPKAQPA
jgi:two-component system sensor histidine kinase KdpD